MKHILLGLITLVMLTGVSEARRSRKKSNTTYKYTYSTPIDNKSAQGVANTMASRNCVAHYGGHHNTYEGCGSGWTKDQAYNNAGDEIALCSGRSKSNTQFYFFSR